jgi:hypothetical protein
MAAPGVSLFLELYAQAGAAFDASRVRGRLRAPPPGFDAAAGTRLPYRLATQASKNVLPPHGRGTRVEAGSGSDSRMPLRNRSGR